MEMRKGRIKLNEKKEGNKKKEENETRKRKKMRTGIVIIRI